MERGRGRLEPRIAAACATGIRASVDGCDVARHRPDVNIQVTISQWEIVFPFAARREEPCFDARLPGLTLNLRNLDREWRLCVAKEIYVAGTARNSLSSETTRTIRTEFQRHRVGSPFGMEWTRSNQREARANANRQNRETP